MPYAGPSDAATSTATATAPRPSHHRRSRSSGNFSDERGPGAFAGLGQLPRLNKKPVFHLNDDDNDNDHDDDSQPAFQPYASPYSPLNSLNSLRLSMTAGKFSPSIEPPPRIEIPPLEPPAAVPFPTSSPSSPPTGPSPFIPHFMSRTSSKSTSPSLPRTPSTPIILSNGKPLKPSLKSSTSSPNISDLPIKHVRAQSCPSTPSASKNVHFAEKDSGLETIRVFNRTGKPASLSRPPGDETETETEAENSSSFPFPVLASPITSSASAALVHEIDPALDRTNPVPKSNPSPYANVFLETLALPKTRPPTLRGTIIVRNMAFEKTVAVRFTLDDWQTTSEVMCKHVVSLPGLPPPFPRARTMGDVAGSIAAGKPTEDEKEASLTWDRFSFTIRLEDYEAKLAERTVYLVVRYNPGCGGEWWDNNDGANYRIGFRRAAASPLPSPAIGVTHSQQRTFSAPSTLRTTPTTGALSSPYTPPTRQLAPAPPQLTRSLSSPFPMLSPSVPERDQQERERMSEKGLGSPTAAYLSRKLSLSNYVAPTASTSIVTPPTTPPGTVRVRSASLPSDAGVAADEPKEKATRNDENVPAVNHERPASPPRKRSPSPPVVSPPPLSPLVDIPGPSPSALATQQVRSFGSYGYGFDGSSALGYSRPQLLSPPRSKESSPASSGTASPRHSPRVSPKNSREGSPDRQQPSSVLGLQVPVTDSPRPMSPLSSAVRELGINMSPAGANPRVGTSDPSYAALLRQWCFAQSSPPQGATAASTPSGAGARSPGTGTGPGALRSGEPTPKVGFGHGSGYGFPGFSFGVPDTGMVGAHMG